MAISPGYTSLNEELTFVVVEVFVFVIVVVVCIYACIVNFFCLGFWYLLSKL